MNEPKAILLCGSRIALPVLRDLFFYGQLSAIVIPAHCVDFIEQVQLLLKNSGMPVIIVNKNDCTVKLQQAFIDYQPTVGLMFTFSFKVPESIYKLPLKGFYNIHPGPLPDYRGPDPIFYQIKNKETYAAITIHKVDGEYDSGPVVLSDKIHLQVTDNHGILVTKLAELATRLVGTLMKMSGFDIAIPGRVQDVSKAHYYKRQSAADISINWNTMDAGSIVALINACNPWNKGAVTKLNNNIIRLLDAYHFDSSPAKDNLPGTIISINDKGLTIATINNEAICVTMIYNDEGFLLAARLKEFGVIPGNRFELV